jgi:rubredoxin
MILRIRKIIEATCPICGWAKDYDPLEFEVEYLIPKICPACGDGKSQTWKTQEWSRKAMKRINDAHDRYLNMVEDYDKCRDN